MSRHFVDGYRADWDKWSQYLETTIDEAVSLSCDIDPDATGEAVPGLVALEYVRRRAIAINHVSGGGLRTVTRQPHGHREAWVRLDEFARWATAHPRNWTLPNRFPPAQASKPAEKPGWPWGAYETPLLKELAATAKHFWADGYKPESAPTKKQVIAWLLKRGQSARVASAIAQILRPDDIPDGPRAKSHKRNG